MSGIVLKATVKIRARKLGKFPADSVAAALAPAKTALQQDVGRVLDKNSHRGSRQKALGEGKKRRAKRKKSSKSRSRAAVSAVVAGNALVVKMGGSPTSRKRSITLTAKRRFSFASDATIGIVRVGLEREGAALAIRALRGA